MGGRAKKQLPEIRVRLGGGLRASRTARGMSLDSVGAAIGRSAQTVSQTELGEVNTPLHMVQAQAQAVGAELYVAVVQKGADEELVARLAAALPRMQPAHRSIIETLIAETEKTQS